MLPRPIVRLACCLAVWFSSVAATAAEQPLALLAPGSLAGWTHGPLAAHGWRMQEGVLVGGAEATELESGWTWADFELSLRWSAAEGDRLELGLDELDPGQRTLRRSVTLRLEGDSGKVNLRQGDKSLASVDAGPASSDGWRSLTIRRTGAQISVDFLGRSLASTALASEARLRLRLSAHGAARVTDLAIREPEGEPLFNGSDLAGWWTPGNLASWQAIKGGVVCLNQDGNYLRTEREYENFTLSMDYKMARGGNSGVGIRTALAGWPSGDGMELQLLDESPDAPLTRHSTLAIYGNLEPLARADRSQQWNHVVIKAEGPMISGWVNGVLVQQANTARLPELRRRQPRGWIGLQDHGARIEVRNMRLLAAPDGPGPAVWSADAPESPSQQVLERLMNPQRLAYTDALRAAAVFKDVTESGEQLLAELEGPAALVELASASEESRLAIYVDDEPQPRVDCAAAELASRLPQVGQDAQPMLTWLPFARRLRVTVRGPGRYRLDYVKLPAGSLEPETSGVARGLLPALSYRNEQLGWGTHREADPLPRAGSPAVELAPGAKKTMLELSGAGIVEWTKLVAPLDTLASDDLWLEVAYDGQSEPAVAAPARYWFPGLSGGNYPNYVCLDRGGATSFAAMPYGRGLKIALHNRGPRAMTGVACVVSYRPLEESEAASLARLRGAFLPAAQTASSLASGQRGRLVGLVFARPQSPAAELSVLVDEHPYGESSPSWRAWLGLADGDGDTRRSLSGCWGGMAWRWFWLAPIDFEKSLALGPPTDVNRLAVFYVW